MMHDGKISLTPYTWDLLMFRGNLVRCATILSGKGFYSFFSFGVGFRV
jgi:hypothetical protein